MVKKQLSISVNLSFLQTVVTKVIERNKNSHGF